MDYTSINSILTIKRKFGLLKYKYNERSFLLYKLSSFIDIKKNKLKPKIFRWKVSKRALLVKLFYKKIREHVFIKTNVKTTRQFKKSKFIYSWFNKKNLSEYNRFNTIAYTLLTFKIFLNLKDACKYIKKFGVFYNFKLTHNYFQLLNVNDVISLSGSFKYYYYLNFMYRGLKRYFRKVKPRIFKLIRHNIDNNKQSATTFPKWVLKFSSFKDHKPTNFEYNYSILTFIVIFNFNFYNNIYFNNNMFVSLYLSRLYNWRYIV